MNDLRAVIRLHRWQLDEKQRALAELRNLEARLHAESERLEEEIRREQQTVRSSGEIAFTYAGFAQAAIGRRERIAQSIAQVETQVAAAVEEMATVFQEVKRYELAQEERDRRDREKQRRRETALLDETAAVGFQRKRADADADSGDAPG
ncbi:MAG: hypothetical protein GC191_14520 [Azospirillum sp.]|nr:hypothetical protein [Azospirillum sp.]